jgi:hypothetical protein
LARKYECTLREEKPNYMYGEGEIPNPLTTKSGLNVNKGIFSLFVFRPVELYFISIIL